MEALRVNETSTAYNVLTSNALTFNDYALEAVHAIRSEAIRHTIPTPLNGFRITGPRAVHVKRDSHTPNTAPPWKEARHP